MQNCEEHYSADKIGRIMAMFDRFKSRLRKEERRQENLRTDEEGRTEVDGSTIDERISNPALSLWAERILLLCEIDPALLTEEDVTITNRNLLAWLTLDNSQRQGPVINMTVEADTFLIKSNGQPITSNMAAREIERLGEIVSLAANAENGKEAHLDEGRRYGRGGGATRGRTHVPFSWNISFQLT